MYEGEDILFLKFATALKLFTSEALTKDNLTCAHTLLLEYLIGFKQVFSFPFPFLSTLVCSRKLSCMARA
jgi:hypothetical protein